MGSGNPIKVMAWECLDCKKIYLSRIRADLCCDVLVSNQEGDKQ